MSKSILKNYIKFWSPRLLADMHIRETPIDGIWLLSVSNRNKIVWMNSVTSAHIKFHCLFGGEFSCRSWHKRLNQVPLHGWWYVLKETICLWYNWIIWKKYVYSRHNHCNYHRNEWIELEYEENIKKKGFKKYNRH